MSRRSLLTPLLLVAVVAVLSVVIPPALGKSPNLGLDLQGGFSVVLQAKPVKGELPSEESVEQAKEIIRQRVDGLGVAEPDITRQGRTVVVQLPGVTDREEVESLIGCTARLEFRPVLDIAPNLAMFDEDDLNLDDLLPEDGDPIDVDPDGGDRLPDADDDAEIDDSGKTDEEPADVDEPEDVDETDDAENAPAGDDEQGAGTVGLVPGESAAPVQFPPAPTVPEFTEDETFEDMPDASETVDEQSDSACGRESFPIDASIFQGMPGEIFPSEDGMQLYRVGPSDVDGEVLSKAEARLLENGEWVVMVSVKSSERVRMNRLFNGCATGQEDCPSGSVAIVLDGQVTSAPVVQAMNLADDEFTISGGSEGGGFKSKEAKDLALVLRYGSLPVVFEQAALQQVSATLGSDSLQAGMIAGVIGIIALGIYMVLYYRGFGLTVVASLLVWMALMYGLVNLLSETQGLALTLAGITGIIVSVGTTVDTYVVVFERIKDLIREGRSVRRATELGYESGIRTVFTANGAAFIGAFLLWWLTVGPVRGFAYFLGLSVILDLIVAVLFTRPLILLAARSNRFGQARFFGVAAEDVPDVDERREARRRRRAARAAEGGDDV